MNDSQVFLEVLDSPFDHMQSEVLAISLFDEVICEMVASVVNCEITALNSGTVLLEDTYRGLRVVR